MAAQTDHPLGTQRLQWSLCGISSSVASEDGCKGAGSAAYAHQEDMLVPASGRASSPDLWGTVIVCCWVAECTNEPGFSEDKPGP
jgi:hypothetical protein